MNAVADELQPTGSRRIHGLDKSALEHKLNDWGNWIEQQSDFEGYPRTDPVAAVLDGIGGGQGGHRILCPDPPARLWSINARILRLPEHEQDAINVWYIPKLKPDGSQWSTAEKCERLKCSEDALYKRLSRARMRLLGVLPLFVGIDCQSEVK